MRTLADLIERLRDESTVSPGHMAVTTIGRERATNRSCASWSRVPGKPG
jgi:hypothetical protein